jgi:hypothetical protein
LFVFRLERFFFFLVDCIRPVAFLVKHLGFSLEEMMNKLKDYKIIRHGFAVVSMFVVSFAWAQGLDKSALDQCTAPKTSVDDRLAAMQFDHRRQERIWRLARRRFLHELGVEP